jgi:hypothetical protein
MIKGNGYRYNHTNQMNLFHLEIRPYTSRKSFMRVHSTLLLPMPVSQANRMLSANETGSIPEHIHELLKAGCFY